MQIRALVAVVFLMAPMTLSAQVMQMIDRLFDFEHVLVYVMAALLMGIFVLLFYNFIYHYRELDAKTEGLSQYARLSLVLQTSNLQLWFYNVQRRHYVLLKESGEYSREYNPVEFAELFNRDDFEIFRKAVFEICEGRLSSVESLVRGVKQANGSHRTFEFSVSVARRNDRGEILSLLCIQHDVTSETQRREAVSQLLMRYHTVFESSLVDMIYYDKNGVLRDINEKACQQFGVKDREIVIRGGFLLQNNPFFSGIALNEMDNTRTTSLVDFGNYTDAVYRIEEFGLYGKMYYESTINPIRNANGELEGIYMAGRNVTEMVESFHMLQDGIKRLRQMTKDVQTYIENINYALRVSNVRLVNYYPSSYTLELSNNVNEAQLHLSQLRCIRLGSPRFRRQISSAINRMDHFTNHPIELNMETEIRDKERLPVWLQFNLVPMKDKEGNVVRYFGMCRDMTHMVETERQLAIETKKAQETELLKQAFLTNMSYEIRTPLNTVVGFAELFETDHDVEDEPLFVEEIRRNSNSLLQLVNDILYLSRLDANMIEYKKEDADFSLLFESYCMLGWSRISPDVKTFVENPYERLIVNIDTEHLGKVVEKLCLLAVSFTEKGFIRAKYEYRHGELTISIEDTGRGIDKITLPKVFGRFVRDQHETLCGTGLDLPIVQALVEQMGGSIEIQSELDKGTTVWVTIPCEASLIEKRRDILV